MILLWKELQKYVLCSMFFFVVAKTMTPKYYELLQMLACQNGESKVTFIEWLHEMLKDISYKWVAHS